MSDEISIRLGRISSYTTSRSAGSRWPESIAGEVRALRELGMPVARISVETGITQSMLYKWLSPRQLNKEKTQFSASPGQGEIKVIDVRHRAFSFHLRWHHLEVRFH